MNIIGTHTEIHTYIHAHTHPLTLLLSSFSGQSRERVRLGEGVRVQGCLCVKVCKALTVVVVVLVVVVLVVVCIAERNGNGKQQTHTTVDRKAGKDAILGVQDCSDTHMIWPFHAHSSDDRVCRGSHLEPASEPRTQRHCSVTITTSLGLHAARQSVSKSMRLGPRTSTIDPKTRLATVCPR